MDLGNSEKRFKPTLGVVAISYNEERDIGAFVDHLKSWVDEIVIIDDGSSDRTKEIAMAGGAKVKFIVSPRKSGEYFSHQRNKGFAESSSEWLLHMDIDERVTPELAIEIKAAVHDGEKDAYRYRRLNFFLHRPMRGGGWQDWNLAHLARREVLKFKGMYHEECFVNAPKERIGQLSNKMWHLNDETYKERMEKSLLYCQEQATHFVEKGIKMHWWKLLVSPFFEFLRKFVKKKGYRDGILGWIFAIHSACAMFRACALVWDQQNAINRQRIERRLTKKWSDSRYAKIDF